MTENIWIAAIPAICVAIPAIITALSGVKGKKYKEIIKMTELNKELILELSNDLSKYISDQNTTSDSYREALKILLRQNIDDMYQLYYKKDKCMSRQAKEELDETFSIYKKLGGNHIGERRYLKMMELPEPDEKEEV